MSRTIEAIMRHMAPPTKDESAQSENTNRALPLSEARRAHEVNQSGHTREKIVLRVKNQTS